MKKILFLVAVLLPVAAAAKVCKVDSASLGISVNEGGAQWQVMAGKAGVGNFLITGIAMCSDDSASSCGAAGNFSDCAGNKCQCKTSNPSMAADGANCFCKQTNPRVGRWVFRNNPGTTADCRLACAMLCARDMIQHSNFRAAILDLP